MRASSDSTANPSGAFKRVARAVADKVVGRAVQPTQAELEARIEELTSVVRSLQADHEAVATDLAGLHNWLDWRFGLVDTDARFDEIKADFAARMEQVLDDIRTLDRHARKLLDVQPTERANAPAAAGGGPERASVDGLLDYDAFEKRFRGDPEKVFAEQVERYAHLVEGHEPVVDIGCGRGGFLTGLAARGVRGIGVEPNPDLAALAREQGIETHEQYAHEYLASVPDGSLGAVVSFQVVEHLSVPDVIRLLDLAVEKLRPGGVFIAETPNPASWIVMHTSFILDPTHVRPLHPWLLQFLCERAGFADVRLEYFAPAEAEYLPTPSPDDAPEWGKELIAAVNRLNEVLFGPQDYAVVGRVPGGS